MTRWTKTLGRVLKAVGLGLAIAGIALLDEEDGDATPVVDVDDDGDVHVMPAYGREHETSVRCWCHPSRDDDRVVLHRDVN